MEGLDSPVARQRLQTDGPNEMGWSARRRGSRLLLDVLREPMFLLLMAAGGIYSALGEWQDAAVLLGFVVAIITITVAQARRTDNALEALRELASPQARVMRDGQVVVIAAREVVRDDLLHLSEGDRVPADAVLLDTHELAADESLLTGESLPVPKALPGDHVMAGTLIVKGQGVARVTATGTRTAFGRIGLSLQHIELPPSPLRQELERMTRDWLIAGISLSLLLAVALWWTQGQMLMAALSGITLAMGLLPQELPVILLVFVALAARRLALRSVLTRRLNAIEALGQVTVLCVDKTGTLTQNRMVLQHVRTVDEQADLPGASAWPVDGTIGQLLTHAALACEIHPHDPMEWAIQEATRQHMARQSPTRSLIREYELSPTWPAMTQVWRESHSDELLIASKGAPETIARMCNLRPEVLQDWMKQVQQMALQGLRVLAVAQSTGDAQHPLPSHQQGLSLNWLGLIGMQDPLRAEVPGAVAQLQDAGIRVVMITGDHPVTALAIAHQAGLHAEQALTGALVAQMDDTQLAHAVAQHRVFARIQPEQKLRLIQALKARDEVVAMTGDGVNDAPALKAAHVGIAMGQPGTDVAREAAALVLLRDDFSLIVEAVRQSRLSIDNLRHAVAYTVAIHLPVAALSLGPVVLGLPALLAPLHIAFMEMVIGPTCALAFEGESPRPSLMHRPPRPLHQALIDHACLHASLLQGTLLGVVLTSIYAGQLHAGMSTPQARTLTFVALVAASMALVMANLQEADERPSRWRPGRTALMVLGLTLAALLLVTTVPPLRQAFGFATVSATGLGMTVLSGLALSVPLRWGRMLTRGPGLSDAPRHRR